MQNPGFEESPRKMLSERGESKFIGTHYISEIPMNAVTDLFTKTCDKIK